MKKLTRILCFTLLIFVFLNGCNSKENTNEDIFQFKDSYVGDNSAVIDIINQLKEAAYLGDIELKTNEAPYGVILNYKDVEAEAYKETMIYNATFIFALVQNADWIKFNFDGEVYEVTKVELEDWYGKELSSFTSEDELSSFTEEYIADSDKVNQLFE